MLLFPAPGRLGERLMDDTFDSQTANRSLDSTAYNVISFFTVLANGCKYYYEPYPRIEINYVNTHSSALYLISL